MTKDIIKLTATMLGLDSVIEYLDGKIEADDEINKTINELLIYTSYILREITKDYYPLSETEELFTNESCEINFSDFSKNVIAIKDIKNELNMSVEFNLYPTYVKLGTPNSKYTITYNYTLPKVTDINDEINLPFDLDYFVVCYGVASEYALSKLLYDEADMWQAKFKNSLENIKSRVGERRFFSRRLK